MFALLVGAYWPQALRKVYFCCGAQHTSTAEKPTAAPISATYSGAESPSAPIRPRDLVEERLSCRCRSGTYWADTWAHSMG